jgi:hypothetical protein
MLQMTLDIKKNDGEVVKLKITENNLFIWNQFVKDNIHCITVYVQDKDFNKFINIPEDSSFSLDFNIQKWLENEKRIEFEKSIEDIEKNINSINYVSDLFS